MRPYDKLTYIRNRVRVRDLRMFRELVVAYFERSEYDTDGFLVDWEGVQSVRSQINRMLPRVVQVVGAVRIATPDATDPGLGLLGLGDSDAVQSIFTSRHVDTSGQEILDVLDMAIGVYEHSRFTALVRTVNPLYYVATTLGFVVGLPRRFVNALGFRPRSRTPGIEAKDVARLEAVASRVVHIEERIEMRFSEMRDRHAQQLAASAHQVGELAERLDFAERMLAQPRPMNALKSPDANDVGTPA